MLQPRFSGRILMLRCRTKMGLGTMIWSKSLIFSCTLRISAALLKPHELSSIQISRLEVRQGVFLVYVSWLL